MRESSGNSNSSILEAIYMREFSGNLNSGILETTYIYIYIYMRESSGNPNSSILEAHRQPEDRPAAVFCHLRLAALSFPPRKNFQARYYFSFCFALLKVYVSTLVT